MFSQCYRQSAYGQCVVRGLLRIDFQTDGSSRLRAFIKLDSQSELLGCFIAVLLCLKMQSQAGLSTVGYNLAS